MAAVTPRGYNFNDYVYQVDPASLSISPKPRVVGSQDAIDLTLFELKECLVKLQSESLYFPCDQVAGLTHFIEELKRYLAKRYGPFNSHAARDLGTVQKLERCISALSIEEQSREASEMQFLYNSYRENVDSFVTNPKEAEELLLTMCTLLNKSAGKVRAGATFQTCKTLLLSHLPSVLAVIDPNRAEKWARELLELDPHLAWLHTVFEEGYPENLRLQITDFLSRKPADQKDVSEEAKKNLAWFHRIISQLITVIPQKPPRVILRSAFLLYNLPANLLSIEQYLCELLRSLEIQEKEVAVELFVWVLKEADLTPKTFQEAVSQLTLLDRVYSWHEKFILDKTAPLQKFLDAIDVLRDKEKTLSGKLSLRVRQLEELPISLQERAILSLFIEKQMIGHQEASSQYIKKTSHNLVRSLQVSPQGVFYLCKRKVQSQNHAFNGPGRTRKITDAIHIPIERNKRLIKRSQVVNKQDAEDQTEVKLRRNQELHLELSHLPGIWPLHSIAAYKQERTCFGIVTSSQHKVSHITDKADGNLDALIKGEVVLKAPELMELILQLSEGLMLIHAMHMVHGKIKPTACLFALNVEEGMKAGIGTLNHAYNPETQKPYFSFERGFYQAVDFTPPELFGVADFKGDYFKVEAFSFGYLLYKLLFKSETHWEKVILRNFSRFGPVPEDEKKDFEEDVHDYVETPLKELNQTKEPSLPMQLKLLVFKLLRFNPEERITVAQFFTELKKNSIKKFTQKDWDETFVPIRDPRSIVIGNIHK